MAATAAKLPAFSASLNTRVSEDQTLTVAVIGSTPAEVEARITAARAISRAVIQENNAAIVSAAEQFGQQQTAALDRAGRMLLAKLAPLLRDEARAALEAPDGRANGADPDGALQPPADS